MCTYVRTDTGMEQGKPKPMGRASNKAGHKGASEYERNRGSQITRKESPNGSQYGAVLFGRWEQTPTTISERMGRWSDGAETP